MYFRNIYGARKYFTLDLGCVRIRAQHCSGEGNNTQDEYLIHDAGGSLLCFVLDGVDDAEVAH